MLILISACRKIFKLKKRPKNNPLIVHYYDFKKVKEDCYLNDGFFKLYKKFCPGPITFILKLKKNQKFQKLQQTKKIHLLLDFQNILSQEIY